jgi:ribonuclease E
MVERPADEEPPITDTAPAEEPQPARAKRSRRKKSAAEAEPTVSEPESSDMLPAEAAEEAAPAAKPARKGRSKKAESTEAKAVPAAGAVPELAANNDTADESSEPRRSGWWQRTFG